MQSRFGTLYKRDRVFALSFLPYGMHDYLRCGRFNADNIYSIQQLIYKRNIPRSH